MHVRKVWCQVKMKIVVFRHDIYLLLMVLYHVLRGVIIAA